ncbi:unnamed protein product [Cuscuta europaea]|uniref:Uncharacterized protein n=1 Tax=Cuscuta europaea TaxID=41803 RepID=A0A9P0Z3H8_CUSEU|nr:unnamed protein product [Cuscuta europaea]
MVEGNCHLHTPVHIVEVMGTQHHDLHTCMFPYQRSKPVSMAGDGWASSSANGKHEPLSVVVVYHVEVTVPASANGPGGRTRRGLCVCFTNLFN